ncbi:hypothetical protein [Novosphingobium colocasiae]|uniref:hypothetical protein n=1 Tax=Novosphingobium colocasiae TaxID=1256513 RepID=UPI0035AF9577
MLKFEIEEQELLDGLVDAISGLPQGQARIEGREIALTPRGGRVDAIIGAMIAGRSLQLLVEARREAFPRDVREAVWQLRNHLAHRNDLEREVVPFFVARAISPGAREILREEKIGFYDLGGTLYIPAPNTFVYIDRPIPPKDSKTFGAIFQGQRARVVQEIFARRPDWVSVKQIAEDAEVSSATASGTLSEMERREWVEVEGAGPSKLRRLCAPKLVLDAWADFLADQKPPKFERYYVSSANAEELAQKLDRACGEADAAYAVTSEAAAQAYAPYLSSFSQVRCRIIPGPQRDLALERLHARPVSEGWNLAVIETRARGDVTVGDRIDGIALARPLQVYLDLLQGSGRAKDMAAHLRTERLEQ